MTLAAALVLAAVSALQGGGSYIVHPDPAAATVAVELWYRVPSAGYDNASPGIARVTIAAIAASAPAKGVSLAELVKSDGGTLSIEVYPDIAMIGASVPAWQAASVTKALTAAYFAPSITDGGLKAALRDTAIVEAENEYDTQRILQDALFSRIFGAGPAHYAAVPANPADLTKISAADARAFAARGLRQVNATLSVAGNVDRAWLTAVHTGIAAEGAQQDPPFDSTPSNAAVDATQSAKVSGIGFAWAGPPISDEKAATAMDFLADYLFDPGYGTLAKRIGAGPSGVYVSGQFITLHKPGVLIGMLSGPNATALRAQVLAAAAALSQPLDASSFAAARNAFIYRIMSQSQTPAGRADNAGWYAAEGNAGYAPGDDSHRYVEIAQSLDPAYVASVARAYLQRPAIVQLLATPKTGSSAT